MENLKKIRKGLVVCMILAVFNFFAAAIGLFNGDNSLQTVKITQISVNLITMVLILVYAFLGYKKPHGNLLRNTVLFFAVLVMARLVLPHGRIESDVLRYMAEGTAGMAAVLIAFISGRLHKIEQNKLLMIIVEILLIVFAVVVITGFPEFVFMRCVSNLTPPIGWVALCLAYVSRYEEHRAAGQKDHIPA